MRSRLRLYYGLGSLFFLCTLAIFRPVEMGLIRCILLWVQLIPEQLVPPARMMKSNFIEKPQKTKHSGCGSVCSRAAELLSTLTSQMASPLQGFVLFVFHLLYPWVKNILCQCVNIISMQMCKMASRDLVYFPKWESESCVFFLIIKINPILEMFK